MNNARKQKIWEVEVALVGLITPLEAVGNAEQEAFDELPFAIQDTVAGKKVEQRIEDIDDLVLLIQEAFKLASDIINNSKGDVHDHHYTD